MMSFIRIVFIVAVIAYAGTCATLYFFQRQLLYFPTPETDSSHAEAFTIENDGHALKIWKARSAAEGDTRKAILYFGGNAETVVMNAPQLPASTPDYDVFFANYRGYGGSGGKPSEAALFSDALALFDVVQDDYDEIAVIGRSLGSGVATYLAAERPVERMFLITPYDSIRHVAQSKFPFIPVSLLLKDHYDSAARAPSVTAPVMIIIAEHDGVIPKRHSDTLAAQFENAPAESLSISGTDHLSVSSDSEFWRALSSFFGADRD